ncbi:MAG: CapA family protein [Clostridia bacterium]|nr:CapA family protein [Clostridia bacterium]
MAKKRRTKNEVKMSLWKLVVFIGIIVAAIVLIINNKDKFKFNKETNQGTEQTAVATNVPEDSTTTISLVMVGDNLIHSSVYKDAQRLAGGKGYDFKPIIEFVKQKMDKEKYDLAYYNQETVLGGTALGVSDYPMFNSPQEAGDAMLDAGFNIVSLATNHTMDRGEKAVLASNEYWKKHENEVLAVGTYSSKEERNKVQIREIKGIKYAMLNYTYGTNGMPVPNGKEYLVNVWPTDLKLNDPSRDTNYQEYKKQVKKDIEAVRDQVDVLLVAMHWGVEYTHEPTAYEKDSAKFLAENGVNIIIGAHPHVIQPVTWIDDTLVVYSLGNFVSAQNNDQNYNKMVGLMTSVNITKTVKDGKTCIKIDNVENELLFTYYKNWSNFKVIPFSNENIGKYLPSYKTVYERYKKVVQKYDTNMKVVEAYN